MGVVKGGNLGIGLDFPYTLATGDSLYVEVGISTIRIIATDCMIVRDMGHVIELAVKIAHGMRPGRVTHLDRLLDLRRSFGGA